MQKIGKVLLFIMTCSCGLQASAQLRNANSSSDSFYLTLSFFNHAEMIFNGTTFYTITGRQLTVKKQLFFSKTDTLLFTKTVDNSTITQLKTIRLDTLKDSYLNFCVMPTSGNEYHIYIKQGEIIKLIYLHHYYRKEIDDIIAIINKSVPKKYKHHYLEGNPENTCSFEQLESIMADTTTH